MMRIAALTSGALVPSARFRVRQYIEPLRGHGIQVDEYLPPWSQVGEVPGLPKVGQAGARLVALAWRAHGIAESWRSDGTWLLRELFPAFPTLEPLLKRPVLFDVDDAIWLNGRFGRAAAIVGAKVADVVLAGNGFLADFFSQYCSSIRIIPTAVDTDRFFPAERSRDDGTFRVGWIGTAANLPYLQSLDAPLADFLDSAPDARLVVVCDRPVHFQRVRPDRVEFVRWRMETEAEIVRSFDVGLMPLPDSDWARGKCSYKMLQYLASGVPAVVSPVGMNQEVLSSANVGMGPQNDGEWKAALSDLRRNSDRRRALGLEGRSLVLARYSRGVMAEMLAAAMRRYVPERRPVQLDRPSTAV